MKNRRYWFICTVAIITMYGSCLNADVTADEPLLPHKGGKDLIGQANPALKGIQTVAFTLIPGADKPDGPALWNKVAAGVTKQLSGAGVDWLKPRPGTVGPVDMPAFTVAIDTLKLADSKQYVFCVRTSLAVDVCLKGDSSRCLKAELWKTASPMRVVSANELTAVITEQAVKQAEAFTLAHLATNQAGGNKPAAPPQTVNKQARRREKQIHAEYLYVASKNSKVFHKADCASAKRISPKNLVGFDAREKAVKTGRRPCKHCNP